MPVLAGFIFVVGKPVILAITVSLPRVYLPVGHHNLGERASGQHRLCEGVPEGSLPLPPRNTWKYLGCLLPRRKATELGVTRRRGGLEKPQIQLVHQPVLQLLLV